MKSLIPTKQQWQSWSLPTKYSVIGVLSGLIGLLGTFAIPALQEVTSVAEPPKSFRQLVSLSRLELKDATQCLSSYRTALFADDITLCGPVKLTATNELFERYESVLFSSSYGEFDNIRELIAVIELRSEAYRQATGSHRTKELENSGSPTIRDIWFSSSFIDWYLCWHENEPPYTGCEGQAKAPVDESSFLPPLEKLPSTYHGTWNFEEFLGYLD